MAAKKTARKAAKPVKPLVASLWERKRDKTLVKVDHVRGGKVTYTTVYMLLVYEAPLEKWAKNFRPHTPTPHEAEAADHVPTSKG